jgi:type IV secretion system protein VirB11
MSESLKKYATKHFGKFLEDDNINEICYNGGDTLFTQDITGKWQEHKTKLNCDSARSLATASASHKNDKVEEGKPILSAILTTGERIQFVLPPATLQDIISITIRKPSKKRYKLDDYEKLGMFDNVIHESDKNVSKIDADLKALYDKAKYKDFLIKAVECGKNIVIAGETGSGKTTFFKSLIDFIPKEERIITIEDVEEIKFYEHKNYVQLFYPSEAKEGDSITSAILLKSCLRMNPKRILLAELRGGETYDFINVISSGHNGTLTSCHAGSVKETFTRLALMTLQNPQGQKLPFDVIENMLKDTIDVVVHIVENEGVRTITEVYFKGAGK